MPDTVVTFSLAAQENLSAQFSRITAALSNLQASERQAFTSLQSSLDATAAKTVTTGNIFTSVFGANFAARIGSEALGAVKDLGEGILGLGEKSLTLAGHLEQAQVSFTGLLGSGGQATAMMQQLRDLDLRSPIFNLQDLEQDAVKLLGVGEAARNILPDLQAIGNEIAGRGQGPQQLQETLLAYTQVMSKGKLAGQEALQFQNAEIPVWQILAHYLNLSTQQVIALSEAGKISAQTFQEAFQADSVERFTGAMERQNGTWLGITNTAKDLTEILLTDFGQGIITQLEGPLDALLTDLQNPAVAATIRQWGEEAGTFLVEVLDIGVEIARWAGLPIPDLSQQIADVNTQAAQLTAHWDSTAASTVTAKDQVKSYRDVIAAINDQQATIDAGYTHQIDPLREQVRLLDQAYQIQHATHSLQDAQQKLADDQIASVNRFSSVGYDAFHRLAADQRAVADAQTNLDRDNTKAKIDNSIAGLEASKKAADEQYAYEKRRYEDLIRKLSETPITPTINTKPLDAATQASSDEYRAMYDYASRGITHDAGATFTAARPNLLKSLFGDSSVWSVIGAAIGSDVGTAIAHRNWLAVGEDIGAGLLAGIGNLWGGTQPGRQSTLDDSRPPVAAASKTQDQNTGDIFTNLAHGNWQGALNAWVAAKQPDWNKEAAADQRSAAAIFGPVNPWTPVRPRGIPYDQQAGIGGSSIGGTIYQPYPGFSVGSNGFEGMSPADAQRYMAGQTQPVIINVPVTVNGRPSANDKAYWDALGPVISQAITNHLYGRR